MRHARTAFILVLLGTLLLATACNVALAGEPGPLTVKQAHRAVRVAHRATERAKAAEREARAVESATRLYSERYGASVGRWVGCARRAGWPWVQLNTLFGVMLRESGGNEHAKNQSSTASGLGQFLAFWWDGSDGSVRALFHKHHLSYPWDPFNGWQNLLHWWAVVHSIGWSPWALTL